MKTILLILAVSGICAYAVHLNGGGSVGLRLGDLEVQVKK